MFIDCYFFAIFKLLSSKWLAYYFFVFFFLIFFLFLINTKLCCSISRSPKKRNHNFALFFANRINHAFASKAIQKKFRLGKKWAIFSHYIFRTHQRYRTCSLAHISFRFFPCFAQIKANSKHTVWNDRLVIASLCFTNNDNNLKIPHDILFAMVAIWQLMATQTPK